MIGRLVARLVLVPLGLLLATAAAMFVVTTVGLERLTQELHRTGDVTGVGGVAWGVFRHWATLGKLVSAVTILPALLLIVVGEVARLRSAMYYVLGGGLALAIIPLLANVQAGGTFQMPSTTLWQVFATGGFTAGFVYWLIAGRTT